jgi:hypothetical protein
VCLWWHGHCIAFPSVCARERDFQNLCLSFFLSLSYTQTHTHTHTTHNLAVIAEHKRDAVLEPELLDLALSILELLLADGDTRYSATEPLYGPARKPSPPAPNLKNVMVWGEVHLVEDEVEFVDLRLEEGVRRGVEDARRVHPRLVVEEQAVHVVAEVVMLCDVLARPLHL